MSLRFAPGLVDLLEVANPPTAEYFNALPDVSATKVWLVYTPVLEKNGQRPKL